MPKNAFLRRTECATRDSYRNQQAMIVYQAQLQTAPNEETNDDMIPESLLLAGVSLAATFLSMGGDPSMIAIPGAMLAAVVALLKATKGYRWPSAGSAQQCLVDGVVRNLRLIHVHAIPERLRRLREHAPELPATQHADRSSRKNHEEVKS